MKRQKHRAKANKGRKTAAAPAGAPAAELEASAKTPRNMFSRRDAMRTAALAVVGTAAAGGLGWYLVEEVQATIREDDFTQIGNGIPTIVQIHDPQCSHCAALQRETRKALSAFDDDELQYVVANTRTTKGSSLARSHGVSHVTLLLFDGEGNRQATLVGRNSSEYLEEVFRRHIGKRGS